MTLKNDAKFEEKLTCSFKNDKNLVNFDLSIQKSHKFAAFLGPFCPKQIMHELKIYRGVMCHDSEV